MSSVRGLLYGKLLRGNIKGRGIFDKLTMKYFLKADQGGQISVGDSC